MKALRNIGSLAFVLGLFTAVFAGIPWYVIVAEDPVQPWWLRTAIFFLLGGILVVLLTVALEQRKNKTSANRWTKQNVTKLLRSLPNGPPKRTLETFIYPGYVNHRSLAAGVLIGRLDFPV